MDRPANDWNTGIISSRLMLTRGGSVATQNTLRRADAARAAEQRKGIVSRCGHGMQEGPRGATYDSATSSGVSGSVLAYGVLAEAARNDARQGAHRRQQGRMRNARKTCAARTLLAVPLEAHVGELGLADEARLDVGDADALAREVGAQVVGELLHERCCARPRWGVGRAGALSFEPCGTGRPGGSYPWWRRRRCRRCTATSLRRSRC